MAAIDELIKSLSMPKAPKRQGFDPSYLADETLDPSIRADAGLGALEGETRDRLFNATRTMQDPQGPRQVGATNPHEVQALSNLLGGLGKQRAAGPLAQQQDEYDTQRLGNIDAQNEGFTGGGDQSPIQARNIYKRKMEQEKMRQPVTVEGMRQAGDTSRQAAQIAGTQHMVETQMEPANRQADLNDDWQEAILHPPKPVAGGAAPAFDPSNVRAINKSGIAFQPTQRAVAPINPNAQNKNILEAVAGLGAQGYHQPWDTMGSGTQFQQQFDNAVRQKISSAGLHPDSMKELMSIMQDPQQRSLPSDVLAQIHNYDTQDPEWPAFSRLLFELQAQTQPPKR